MIDVDVLDPGVATNFPDSCFDETGYKLVPHSWQILKLDESGATWMCPRCRRIERRSVAPNPDPSEYQIALREDDLGLDDVVVKNVEMFRMERMDTDVVWLCCYLADGQRLDFDLRRKGKKIIYNVRPPLPDAVYEERDW